MVLQFEDAFWHQDICSTAGFETLHRKIKEGRKVVKEYDEFLKQRAKLEEEFGKNLQSLLKKTNLGEVGSLGQCWEVMKTQTERIAKEHIDTSQLLVESSTRLTSLIQAQKTQLKNEEESMKKIMRRKVELYKRQGECKLAFHSKCKEMESQEAQIALTKQQKPATLQTKDFDKLVSKHEKTKTDRNSAEKQYRESLNSLSQLQNIWEREHVQICKSFQQVETDRLTYLKNEMWIYTNIISDCCVHIDQHAEGMRQHLQQCSIEKDLQDFVREKAVGKVRPGKVEFVDYIPKQGHGQQGHGQQGHGQQGHGQQGHGQQGHSMQGHSPQVHGMQGYGMQGHGPHGHGGHGGSATHYPTSPNYPAGTAHAHSGGGFVAAGGGSHNGSGSVTGIAHAQGGGAHTMDRPPSRPPHPLPDHQRQASGGSAVYFTPE